MPHLPPSLLYIKKENKSLAMSGFSIYLTLYDCMSRKLHSSQMEKMRCEENIKIRKQSGKQKAASNGSLAETVTVNSLFHESRAKETWFSQKLCPVHLISFSSILNFLLSFHTYLLFWYCGWSSADGSDITWTRQAM